MSENTLSKGQSEFIELGLKGENIFLTGEAGTGKSYVVQTLISLLKKTKKHVIAIAPTGVAANNIGGTTMHSMFGLGINGVLTFEDARFLKTVKRKVLQKADVIIVDEVSMVRPDILDSLNWTLIKNGMDGLASKQVIFVGDLKQLPAPIKDNMMSVLLRTYKSYEFYHAKIYKQLDVKKVELKEVLRQSDPEFIENLNIVRNGGKSEYFRKFVGKEQKGIILAPHNTTVSQYNRDGLSKIDAVTLRYDAKIFGSAKPHDFNLENKLKLKDGCKIMYLVNSDNNPLFNGSIGIFRYKDKLPFIEIDGNLWLIQEVEFAKKEYVFNEDLQEMELIKVGSIKQLPVKLAYALTIHKSQGLTFDEVTIDLTKPCFAKGQLYTALSRVRSPEGLTLKVNK